MIRDLPPLRVTRWGASYLGRRFPCSIGKTGITRDKREGDGATPAGVFHLTGWLARPDRLHLPGAGMVTPTDGWCDAADDPLYNQPVTLPYPASHERLRRADPLYNVIGLTDWNEEGQPGKGSAIFIHRWRGPRRGTEGCIAFAPAHLDWIARRAAPGTPIIVTG